MKKKELQRLVLQIIEKSDNEDDDDKGFHNFQNYLDTQRYEGNKPELEHFLHLILIISMNHFRCPNFFQKIEKILTISSKYYKPAFSDEELFDIFKESKPILLFLLKTNIIVINEIIFKNLLSYSEPKDGEIYYYFYPELKSIITSGTIESIQEESYEIKLNEDIEIFERNHQQFENDSYICSLIRDDLVEDFIQYVNKNSISLESEINHSIFDTNSMFIEKDPTLIEYAAFFGAIQIMQYLEVNKAKLSPSLWLYAVHSNNPEVIQFLEEKQIRMDDRTFSEVIKCHHNSIAHYLYDNISASNNIASLDDESVLSIYLSANYEFFQYEIDENKIFYSLCHSNNTKLVELYLKTQNERIETYIKNNSYDTKIIHKSLIENKIDIAYQLLKQFSSISSDYFKYESTITKIALPPTILSIEQSGFENCTSLKHISIPSSVTSIDNFAFFECDSLEEIEIPSSVTFLGNVMFYLSPIKKVKLSSSLKRIDNCTFQGDLLSQIVIPPSVTEIGALCFDSCSKLKKVTIPSSVTIIESGAFLNCSELKNVIIPNSVKLIDESAFQKCSSLTEVLFAMPSSLNSIKKKAFYDCSSLKQISIPSSVNSIEENAFNGCISLSQISIPVSIEINSIGIQSNTKIIKIL